jgi:hypothetical protein
VAEVTDVKEYGGVGKKGDKIQILSDGPKGELDEAIVFVYRETPSGWKIVGHFADY